MDFDYEQFKQEAPAFLESINVLKNDKPSKEFQELYNSQKFKDEFILIAIEFSMKVGRRLTEDEVHMIYVAEVMKRVGGPKFQALPHEVQSTLVITIHEYIKYCRGVKK